MQKPIQTDSAARSVQGTQAPKVLATSTTAGEIDLTTWAGQYVKVTFQTAGHYWLMAQATGATINEAATSGDTACDHNVAGSKEQFLVDRYYPFLRVKTDSATGYVRVSRA